VNVHHHPQERENRSPASCVAEAYHYSMRIDANTKAAATATVTSRFSSAVEMPTLSPGERAGVKILPNGISRFEPLNRAVSKVGQASRLPSERVSASMPVGFRRRRQARRLPYSEVHGEGERKPILAIGHRSSLMQ
jgi:hypothetical protein